MCFDILVVSKGTTLKISKKIYWHNFSLNNVASAKSLQSMKQNRSELIYDGINYFQLLPINLEKENDFNKPEMIICEVL